MWRISLFGALTFTSPEGEVFRAVRNKPAELVAFLALRRVSMVDRDTVVAALWPDADFNTGRNRLKQTLAVLRREVPEIPILIHGKNVLELDRARVEIDAEAINGRLKWLGALQVQERSGAARQIWEVVRLGLLPEVRAEWILPEQARFEEYAQRLLKEFSAVESESPAAFRFGDRLRGARVPLIGRKAQMERIDGWLRSVSMAPLLLVGPPGVGKTRLLVEAIAPERSVCDALITLSTVQAFESPWLERIGQAIGVRDNEQVTQTLIKLLRGFSRPLLAIDDFDQASQEMRDWLLVISRSVPRLRLLGTCRRREEGFSAEYLEIEPLASGNGEATRLLAHFAASFGVSQAQLEQNAPAIAAIAKELEGLPLALEVAAGWLPYVQPSRMLAQLAGSMQMVIDRPASEHDSLRECVRAMVGTLSAGERATLRVLSVCRGGCGEEFGNLMFGADWPTLIRSLTERSLVFRVEGKCGNRFVSLQAIRESVARIEAPQDLAQAVRIHQEAMFELAERAAWETSEGDRAGGLDFMRDECDNLLISFSVNLEERATLDRVARLVHVLRVPFYLIRRTSDYLKTSEAVRRLASESYPDASWQTPALVLRWRVRLLWDAGRQREAVEMAAAHRESTESSNPSLFEVAEAHDFECDFLRRMGDLPESFDRGEVAQDAYRKAGYAHHALWMDAKLSALELAMGKIQEGEARRAIALETAIALGDHNSTGMQKKRLAKTARSERRYCDAIRLCREAIDEFALAGESVTRFDGCLVLAACHLASGDRGAALEALEEARELIDLADPESVPDYSRLMDAARYGVPLDLDTIDSHPYP